MTVALISLVKSCLWLCRVGRDVGFKQSGPWREIMVLLCLNMRDQTLPCTYFPAVLTWFLWEPPGRGCLSATLATATISNMLITCLMLNFLSQSKSCTLVLTPVSFLKAKTAAFQTKLGRDCNLYSMWIIKGSVAAWILSSAGETNFFSCQLMQVKDDSNFICRDILREEYSFLEFFYGPGKPWPLETCRCLAPKAGGLPCITSLFNIHRRTLQQEKSLRTTTPSFS